MRSRIFILLMLCCIYNVDVQGRLTEEELKIVKNFHDICVEETGVSESVIADVNKGNISYKDHKLKCYMKCMLMSAGILDDDGVFSYDAYIDLLNDSIKDFGRKTKAHCENRIGHDGDICETAFKISMCMREANPDVYVLL